MNIINNRKIKFLLSAILSIMLMFFISAFIPEINVKADYFELMTEADRTGKIIKEDEISDGSIVSAAENGNFRITLKTDKTEYHAGDPVRMKAEIEYIGSKNSIEISCCDPVVTFRIEGSNGLRGDTSAFYNKNAMVKKVFDKGEKYEVPFSIEGWMNFVGDPEAVFGENGRPDSGEETVLHLPQGTYAVMAALSDELAKKQTASFYAELHINIDVEGEVFYSGSNLYRTAGKDEAVLIGTKLDNVPAANRAHYRQGTERFIIPAKVKYNGKEYKVTQIGDDGIRYIGYVDDYEYGYLDYGVFSEKSFSDVRIPSSVKKISRSAFKDTSLHDVSIEADNIEIGEMAFKGSGYFGEFGTLTIKGGDVKVDKLAFDYSWFKTVDLHNLKSLEIGEKGFADLYGLKSISLPENTVSIGNMAFYDSADRKDKVILTIPKGTKNIEGSVTNTMIVKLDKGNTSFVIRYGLLMTSDGSTVLGLADFRTKVIALPEGVTEIKPYAFSATPVKKITIPDSVTVIPEGMAARANSLKKVKLGKNVTEIGDNAFRAARIKKIKLPSGLKSIGSYAFANCRLSKVVIPKNVEYIGNRAFSGNYNLNLTFKKHNKNFKQSGGLIYKPGTQTVIGYINNKRSDISFKKLDLQFAPIGSIYSITIPESIDEIDISSFSPKLMGEYYTGKNEVYEGARITFESKEPPKFVDERYSEKDFFVWILISEDADINAFKKALEGAGLEDGKNYMIDMHEDDDEEYWGF